MRYLAIDYGNKRTGLAICDASEIIATPLAVIETNTELLKKIVNIIKTENVEAIILGMPLNMDDSQGPQAKIVLRFAEQLKQQTNLPINFQDERLSTFAAEGKIAAAELTRKKKKKRIDAIAAAQILEAFIEQKKQNQNPDINI